MNKVEQMKDRLPIALMPIIIFGVTSIIVRDWIILMIGACGSLMWLLCWYFSYKIVIGDYS